MNTNAFVALTAMPLVMLLTACGTPSSIRFQIQAGTDINPGRTGEANPTSVRLYVLSSSTRIRSADYFELADHERETLDGEFLLRRDVTIRPGESQEVHVSIPDTTTDIAVVAGFRNLDQATWMATRPLARGRVAVLIEGTTVSLPDQLPRVPSQSSLQLPSPSLPSALLSEPQPQLPQMPVKLPANLTR